MSAPSTLLTNLSSQLSADSQQLLVNTGVLSTSTTDWATSPTSTVAPRPFTHQPPMTEPSDEEKLDLFDTILDEAEHLEAPSAIMSTNTATDVGTQTQSTTPVQETVPTNTMSDAASFFTSVTPQALPQATEDIWQQAQPPQPLSSIGKERTTKDWTIESAVQESGGMLTAVEQEKQPEISAEVENYLQRVEDTQESPAKELAQLIPTVAATTSLTPTEVVRVLPVTKTVAEIGHKKSPKFSVRWLVEWSDKVIKMFQGKVVYKTT